MEEVRSQAGDYQSAVSETNELTQNIQALEEELSTVRARAEELRRRRDAWPDWNAFQEVEESLSKIPDRPDFPDDPIGRLDAFEKQCVDADEGVVRKRGELERVRKTAEGSVASEELLGESAAVEEIRRGRGRFDNSVRDLPTLKSKLNGYRSELTQALKGLGAGWDDKRLKAFDTSLLRRDEIKQRKTAELHLLEALENAETSNRELERFAFIASHDLQEPLRKIQTFGDRIQRSGDTFSEKNQSYLKRMRASAERMQTLIKNTLSFSRLSSDAMKFRSINANSAIQTVLDDISLLVNDKQADIRVDNIGVILADKGHIMRVFQNLLQNSLKFVAPERHPVIEITVVDRTEEHITLAFKDNGIGFDNQYASRIFNLFERLHGKSEFEGTGMGLAICRKIVEKHNGSIWAEGRENEGSVFYMQLPVK